MDFWENKRDFEYGVHYSRWIASWIHEGGSVGTGYESTKLFADWLKSLHVAPDDIQNMVRLVQNGKRELESSAREFIEKASEKD